MEPKSDTAQLMKEDEYFGSKKVEIFPEKTLTKKSKFFGGTKSESKEADLIVRRASLDGAKEVEEKKAQVILKSSPNATKEPKKDLPTITASEQQEMEEEIKPSSEPEKKAQVILKSSPNA